MYIINKKTKKDFDTKKISQVYEVNKENTLSMGYYLISVVSSILGLVCFIMVENFVLALGSSILLVGLGLVGHMVGSITELMQDKETRQFKTKEEAKEYVEFMR